MSSNRHLARIIALQSLYEYEFRTHADVEGLESDIQEILERNLAVYTDTMQETEFVRDLVKGSQANQTKADAMIEPAAPEWPIDQIAKMDLTILRLAIYELACKREVPPKVVINEAVELAKSFGGENSSKFINGVLGTIYRQSEFYDATEDHKAQRDRADHKAPQTTPAQRPTSAQADVDSPQSAGAEPISQSGDPVSTSPGETDQQADAVEQYEEGPTAPKSSPAGDDTAAAEPDSVDLPTSSTTKSDPKTPVK